MECVYKTMKETCGITSKRDCKDCRFRKTADQANADRDKSFSRLRKLPDEFQTNISEKYYFGKMPWNIHNV